MFFETLEKDIKIKNEKIMIQVLDNENDFGLIGFQTDQVSFDVNSNNNSILLNRIKTEDKLSCIYEIEPEGLNFFKSPLIGVIMFEKDQNIVSILIERKENYIVTKASYKIKIINVNDSEEYLPSKPSAKISLFESNPELKFPQKTFKMTEPSIFFDGSYNIPLTKSKPVNLKTHFFWSINPIDDSVFEKTKGLSYFHENENLTYVLIKTLDDSTPDLFKKYTLEIKTLVSNKQTTCEIVLGESDFPRGYLGFEKYFISSKKNTEKIAIFRDYGLHSDIFVDVYANEVFFERLKIQENSSYAYIFLNRKDYRKRVLLKLEKAFFNDFSNNSGIIPPTIGIKNTIIIEFENFKNKYNLNFEKSYYEVFEGDILEMKILTSGILTGKCSFVFETVQNSAIENKDYILQTKSFLIHRPINFFFLKLNIIDENDPERTERLSINIRHLTGIISTKKRLCNANVKIISYIFYRKLCGR